MINDITPTSAQTELFALILILLVLLVAVLKNRKDR